MSTPTKTNVVHGMSNHDYHAQTSISKSGLDLIRKAPAIYKHRRENPLLPTDAMRMGTLVHTAVLEPHLLDDLMVAPKFDRRTSAGKAEYEAFMIASEGKEIVSQDELDRLHAITKAVHAHPGAGAALASLSTVEASIFWTDPDTGIDCRCRPDGILSNGVIVDLKTTRGAAPDEFAKSIAQYRYHVQSAFYSDGYAAAYGDQPKGFMFIAVGTEPPFLVACYVASAAMVARGRADYQTDLRTFAWCIENNEWPGLAPEPIFIDLPRWA